MNEIGHEEMVKHLQKLKKERQAISRELNYLWENIPFELTELEHWSEKRHKLLNFRDTLDRVIQTRSKLLYSQSGSKRIDDPELTKIAIRKRKLFQEGEDLLHVAIYGEGEFEIRK